MTKPILRASFLLDENGTPKADKHGDLKHYFIRLEVDGAPHDAYAVTYELHDSYYEPIRESRDAAANYAEDLTSYGDYTLRAKVRGRTRTDVIAVDLSRALERSYRGTATPAIAEALKDIRER